MYSHCIFPIVVISIAHILHLPHLYVIAHPSQYRVPCSLLEIYKGHMYTQMLHKLNM